MITNGVLGSRLFAHRDNPLTGRPGQWSLPQMFDVPGGFMEFLSANHQVNIGELFQQLSLPALCHASHDPDNQAGILFFLMP